MHYGRHSIVLIMGDVERGKFSNYVMNFLLHQSYECT